MTTSTNLNKSHTIQIVSAIAVCLGLAGGGISCYVSVIKSQARTEQQLVDMKDKLDGNFAITNGRLQDVQNNINSINDFLRGINPLKRADSK